VSAKARTKIGCSLACGYCAGWAEASLHGSTRMACVELQCVSRGAPVCEMLVICVNDIDSQVKSLKVTADPAVSLLVQCAKAQLVV